MSYPLCPCCDKPLGDGHTHVDTITGRRVRVAPAEAAVDHDVLRQLWTLSQRKEMIVWIAGEIQTIVTEVLRQEENADVDVEAVLWPAGRYG